MLRSGLFVLLILFFSLSCTKQKATHLNYTNIRLSNEKFSGTLLDNISNRERQGSGFNPLIHTLYPLQNIYNDEAVGLNLEHIMNGTAADADKCMFTPRKDSCYIHYYSDSSASIIHEAKYSSWNIDSELRYTFAGGPWIDLDFQATLREDNFPLGYVAFMWASYMNCAISRKIYFPGRIKGEERWISFGDETDGGFETGTIGHADAADLPYEEGTVTLNIIENKDKKFTLPLCYGIVHGSGQIDNYNDTMVYIMMFDQDEPIRFAMWNFFTNPDGEPDTHRPAWDWQYVIRNPEIDKTYGYRARIVYKQYKGRDDILSEYEIWKTKFLKEREK